VRANKLKVGKIPGVLMDIFGVGVLITGESGLGKSESALDLISRGHRLVSDDVVEIRKLGRNEIIGSSPSITKNLMEVRGLGIIDIKEIFGVSSVTSEKKIELVINLSKYDDEDRLKSEEEWYEIEGVKFPMVKIPVASGRNTSILIEVAVKQYLMKKEGKNTTKELLRKIERKYIKNGEKGK
jgi:HPr kinase/phosphorylase